MRERRKVGHQARSCTVKLIVCAGQCGPWLGDGQRLESSQRQVFELLAYVHMFRSIAVFRSCLSTI
jgi:hypothetical protein